MQPISEAPQCERKKILPLSMLGEVEGYNLAIHLNESMSVHLPYGIKREFDILLLYIDQKEKFISTIEQEIINRQL